LSVNIPKKECPAKKEGRKISALYVIAITDYVSSYQIDMLGIFIDYVNQTSEVRAVRLQHRSD
jgi:hypothetical protein